MVSALQHLAGEEPYSQPNEQAANLPKAVLVYIKTATRKALIQVPYSNTPALDFIDIKRRPSKPRIKSWLPFARIIHRQFIIIWIV